MYAKVLAAQYSEHQLLEMYRQYGNRVFKVAANIKAAWERQELMQILEESKQVPHKPVCTTSIGDGESDDEDTDWRERYESTREAPYGCLTEEDMKRAIQDGDLDIIEDSPVLANITLGNMFREDPEFEEDLDSFIRNHKDEDTISSDELQTQEYIASNEYNEFSEDEQEDAQYIVDSWSDIPDTDLNLDALVMIEEQRSLSPKRQTWKDQRKLSQALLEIF